MNRESKVSEIELTHLFFNSTFDTANDDAFITLERMNAFQFTNAYYINTFVAIYYQQNNPKVMINTSGITAGISINVYIIAILALCVLVVLFALIERARPTSAKTFDWL